MTREYFGNVYSLFRMILTRSLFTFFENWLIKDLELKIYRLLILEIFEWVKTIHLLFDQKLFLFFWTTSHDFEIWDWHFSLSFLYLKTFFVIMTSLKIIFEDEPKRSFDFFYFNKTTWTWKEEMIGTSCYFFFEDIFFLLMYIFYLFWNFYYYFFLLSLYWQLWTLFPMTSQNVSRN